MGGDPVVGLYYIDLLDMFQNDPQTDAIVMIGEIGGNAEELKRPLHQLSNYQTGDSIHRRTIGSSGKQMGHAGAIISSGSGTAWWKGAGTYICRELGGGNLEVPLF